MKEKTLWDFLNTAKLFNKKDFLILQGSTSLFLHGVIKRIPHDIDILFHNSLSLRKRNELWNIFIKNFQVTKYEINNELVKKCFVLINEESLKIESILGKNISDYFIDKSFSLIKTTNINYFFASKIIQLSNSFNIQYKSIVDRNNKINNILSDINELIEKYEISIDELIKSLIENIKSNIGYEIISLRNQLESNMKCNTMCFIFYFIFFQKFMY